MFISFPCCNFRCINTCSRPQVNLETTNGKSPSGNTNEDGHTISNGDEEQPPRWYNTDFIIVLLYLYTRVLSSLSCLLDVGFYLSCRFLSKINFLSSLFCAGYVWYLESSMYTCVKYFVNPWMTQWNKREQVNDWRSSNLNHWASVFAHRLVSLEHVRNSR